MIQGLFPDGKVRYCKDVVPHQMDHSNPRRQLIASMLWRPCLGALYYANVYEQKTVERCTQFLRMTGAKVELKQLREEKQ
jgi:hypothetical protein